MRPYRAGLRRFLVPIILIAALTCGVAGALLGTCGPFTDTANDAFCPFILEVFYLGITTGTTPTTYDPTGNVNRTQMAAFLSRSVDAVLKRGSRRAALKQFATPQVGDFLGSTTVQTGAYTVECDGADLWVSSDGGGGGTISRVRASDGKLLGTWTGATSAYGLLVALGRIFVTGNLTPGRLYSIDPSGPAGLVTTVSSNLGGDPASAAFDGSRIWTANASGSVSVVFTGAAIPWSTTTLSLGPDVLSGLLFDGSNIWVSDSTAGTLLKLDGGGAVLKTVTVGEQPYGPMFDGTNIWVPNLGSNSVSVVRAATGSVVSTLTGNGLNGPLQAAFDGERVLVTNHHFFVDSVSLWKAADLTAIGTFPTGSGSAPAGAASDGVNFWIVLSGLNKLARF